MGRVDRVHGRGLGLKGGSRSIGGAHDTTGTRRRAGAPWVVRAKCVLCVSVCVFLCVCVRGGGWGVRVHLEMRCVDVLTATAHPRLGFRDLSA